MPRHHCSALLAFLLCSAPSYGASATSQELVKAARARVEACPKLPIDDGVCPEALRIVEGYAAELKNAEDCLAKRCPAGDVLAIFMRAEKWDEGGRALAASPRSIGPQATSSSSASSFRAARAPRSPRPIRPPSRLTATIRRLTTARSKPPAARRRSTAPRPAGSSPSRATSRERSRPARPSRAPSTSSTRPRRKARTRSTASTTSARRKPGCQGPSDCSRTPRRAWR